MEKISFSASRRFRLELPGKYNLPNSPAHVDFFVSLRGLLYVRSTFAMGSNVGYQINLLTSEQTAKPSHFHSHPFDIL